MGKILAMSSARVYTCFQGQVHLLLWIFLVIVSQICFPGFYAALGWAMPSLCELLCANACARSEIPCTQLLARFTAHLRARSLAQPTCSFRHAGCIIYAASFWSLVSNLPGLWFNLQALRCPFLNLLALRFSVNLDLKLFVNLGSVCRVAMETQSTWIFWSMC